MVQITEIVVVVGPAEAAIWYPGATSVQEAVEIKPLVARPVVPVGQGRARASLLPDPGPASVEKAEVKAVLVVSTAPAGVTMPELATVPPPKTRAKPGQ